MTAILDKDHDEVVDVAFPYFGNREHDHFQGTDHPDVLMKRVPVRELELKEGRTYVATVFDLLCANYGLDRGLGGEYVARDYAIPRPTPRPGVRRSPAFPPMRSSPPRANSPPMPKRPTASRW
jgi:nitrate reductase alpha subunit